MDGVSVTGYRLIRCIGLSQSSRVYLAENTDSGQVNAIKILSNNLTDENASGALRRFQQEFLFQSQLTHIHIVPIRNRIEQQSTICHVMDYFQGKDLSHKITLGLQPNKTIDYLLQLMSALEYIHDQNIAHLDVKPKNILFGQNGALALTDFGIASYVDASKSVCQTNTIMGSPYYMSPEQIDNGSVDQRSDLYSLGVIFYEMLTGRKPFDGFNLMQVFYAHLNEPIPQLPQTIKIYQPIIDGLLAKQLTNRFANIADLRTAIQKIEQGTSVEEEPILA